MLPDFEQFQASLDQQVELAVADQQLPARVVEVKALRQQHEADRQPFSVVLVTDQAEPFEQQIFMLRHPDLGRFELFLVPIGPRGEGMAYEAVIT